MDFSKIASIVTPFMLLALGGILMVIEGLFHIGRENNALQFIFGIPIAIGAVGFHFLVRRLLKGNNLYIWIVEGFIALSLGYQFMYVW
ncbi:hypothetical protein [Spirosoma sp.]|uniref:hypothetical protein n=1 Tax=Spirosoma sp. TaxID=1899569 RepID=UPI003B3B052D